MSSTHINLINPDSHSHTDDLGSKHGKLAYLYFQVSHESWNTNISIQSHNAAVCHEQQKFFYDCIMRSGIWYRIVVFDLTIFFCFHAFLMSNGIKMANTFSFIFFLFTSRNVIAFVFICVLNQFRFVNINSEYFEWCIWVKIWMLYLYTDPCRLFGWKRTVRYANRILCMRNHTLRWTLDILITCCQPTAGNECNGNPAGTLETKYYTIQ